MNTPTLFLNSFKAVHLSISIFKITALLLFAVFIVTGLTGCKKEEYQIKSTECVSVEISYNEFIKMCVQPEKDSKTLSAQMVIENNTKQDILFDSSFVLEFYKAGQWETIHLGINFEDIIFVLKSNETKNLVLFTQTMYDFKAGKYRIKKTISTEQSSYDFSIEFEIIIVLS